MIDADNNTVQDRFNQLDQALQGEGMPIVELKDRIARLVPRRNVETWILYLTGSVVDEDTDYRNSMSDWNRLIPLASKKLRDWRRQTDEPAIASLLTGVRELRCLPF